MLIELIDVVFQLIGHISYLGVPMTKISAKKNLKWEIIYFSLWF